MIILTYCYCYKSKKPYNETDINKTVKLHAPSSDFRNWKRMQNLAISRDGPLLQDKGLYFLGISHYWAVIFIFVYRVLSLANPRF